MDKYIESAKSVKGSVRVPGDKSISHRAVMIGALARGETLVHNFLKGEDCLATIQCFNALGIKTEFIGETLRISGRGLYGLKKPDKVLYTSNSGTTTRLICGILAGQPFESRINGDASLKKRPMKRIIEPLTLMGANIEAHLNEYCPLTIRGSELKGISFSPKTASAQLKSCIMLAGLYAQGQTVIKENVTTRDHTEIMLKAFGGNVTVNGKAVCVKAGELKAREVNIPSDISSAAYFIVLTLISHGGELVIENVGVNPTRTGIIDALKQMGAHIELKNYKNDIEPVADIYVKASRLRGINIGGDIIPRIIDELPVFAVAAAYAEGVTVISGAEELKYKESNRIKTIVAEIGKCGAHFSETEDGIVIEGTDNVIGAEYDSHGDHRIAMAAAVAAAFARGSSLIRGAECVAVSYPNFFETLNGVLL